MRLEDFDYQLPDERIAKYPLEERSASKLLVYERGEISERRFRDIHTVTQQLQGRLSHFETVGAWMMDAEADLTFV